MSFYNNFVEKKNVLGICEKLGSGSPIMNGMEAGGEPGAERNTGAAGNSPQVCDASERATALPVRGPSGRYLKGGA